MTRARPLRFIHVGTGGWGRRWSDTFLARLVMELGVAEPAAAVDTDARQLRHAQRGYGISARRCYTDLRQALAENRADFIVVAAPPAAHEAVIQLAVENGLHILCEKPLADTMPATARIYHRVQRAGLKLAVTMSHRFDQDKQTLERLVRSGQYGPLSHLAGRLLVNSRRPGEWGFVPHGDVTHPLLIEAATHQFDIVRALAASNARRVYASSWRVGWTERDCDTTALALIEMENGVRALYEGSVSSAATRNGWQAEYWRAECRDAILELDRRRLTATRGAPQDEPSVEELPLDERPAWSNSWLAEWFVDWLSGGEPPSTTLEDNIHCQALTMAAVESADSGQVVDVKAFLERHLDEAGAS
ncbi:MAG: Gfo/Idh/MocA family oxidoreductase [Chloroflexota bacterium]|nr:Gfo/Idh/MocA family oxidoreductase [Chloroflexota bacterium]